MYKKLLISTCTVAFLFCLCTGAQAANKKTFTTTVTKTAQTPAAKWLDRIEAKAKKIKTLSANVRYDRIQGLLGDTQRRWGTLIYKSGPPAEFSVHFDKLAVDRAARQQNRWFIYDGHWLAEKYSDQHIFIRHELVPKGKKRDLLALGKGPFVLPLDAQKKKIFKKYSVKVIDDAKHKKGSVLENTIHLQLTPKKNNQIKLTQIDLWYKRDTLWPVQATTHDQSKNVSVITLSHIKVNIKIGQDAFDTTPPTEPGWDIRIKRYQPPHQASQSSTSSKNSSSTSSSKSD